MTSSDKVQLRVDNRVDASHISVENEPLSDVLVISD